MGALTFFDFFPLDTPNEPGRDPEIADPARAEVPVEGSGSAPGTSGRSVQTLFDAVGGGRLKVIIGPVHIRAVALSLHVGPIVVAAGVIRNGVHYVGFARV